APTMRMPTVSTTSTSDEGSVTSSATAASTVATTMAIVAHTAGTASPRHTAGSTSAKLGPTAHAPAAQCTPSQPSATTRYHHGGAGPANNAHTSSNPRNTVATCPRGRIA